MQLNLELLLKRKKLAANIKDFVSLPSIFAVVLIWYSMNAPIWLKLAITVLAIVIYSTLFKATIRSMSTIVDLRKFVMRMLGLVASQIAVWIVVIKFLSRLFPGR